MGKMIYLAYPIDCVDLTQAAALQSDVQSVRNYFSGAEEAMTYDPGRAWQATHCEPDGRLQMINSIALTQADLVFALLPPGHESIGVPMEVGLASHKGIPSIVVGARRSWALQADNIYLCGTVEEGIRRVGEVLDTHVRLVASKPLAQYVEEHRIPDLDPTPIQGYDDDAGFDLICYIEEPIILRPGESANVPAGVAIEWPPNTWGLILGRSSTFHKRGLLVNPGVIDPGYRGDLFNNVRNISNEEHTIYPGDRIAQIIPLPALAPRLFLVSTDKLSDTARGASGFGSSGK